MANKKKKKKAAGGTAQVAPGFPRIGLMGGTFDPVHNGHIQCAQAAMEQLGLERVLFIPAGVPVYKLDQAVTSADDRIAMLKAALEGHEAFSLDLREVERPGKTFTSDTVRELRQELPANTDLVFIAGADAALTMPQWHEADYLADQLQVAAIVRPGCSVNTQAESYRRLMDKFLVTWIDASTQEVSSSDIRQKVATGKPVDQLVARGVAAYIAKRGLYQEASLETSESTTPETEEVQPMIDLQETFEEAESQPCDQAAPQPALEEEPYFEPAAELVEDAIFEFESESERNAEAERAQAQVVDPLSKEFYQMRKQDMKGRVDKRRFKHVVGVAKTAKKIAKAYGIDTDKARLAGILHDWDKNFDDEGIRRRAEEVGLDVDPLVRDCMAQTLHGMTASRALARDFPMIPQDVLQAVDRHTTACKDMADLDMVVFIADCLEPSRRFGRCDELRALIGKVSLEELFFQVHGYWITLIIARGRTMHPSTVETWNYYALRHAARKAAQREKAGLPPKKINPCAVSEK